MNRYIFIRRLRGPAIIVLVGVVALLHQMGAVRFWHIIIPLFLILLGVLLLAERAALAADGPPPFPDQYPGQYPGQNPGPYPGQPYSAATDPLVAAQQPAQTGTSIVPAHSHDFDSDPNRDRGQS